MTIFSHLGNLPIRIWDESRLAINAFEMLENKNFIVTYFSGFPDMWNTKPPLLIWFQVFFMKIIGINETAIRLPSAFAAFFTCIILLLFFNKFFKTFWFGFITVFVLVTSYGYISMHGTRTGDYDALLTLFTTLGGLLFFTFCETKNYKYLYLFFLFTTLGVLTKGVAGLLFLPAILIYSIIQNKFILLLKNKHFYIGLSFFISLVASYYIVREINNIGYIVAVIKNELGGRYLETLDNHKHKFLFFYENLINYRLSSWYLLVPCGLITGLVIKNKKINRITLFSFLMITVFFLVISTAQTKLEWYDLPLYPFLAILIAVFIYYLFCLLKNFRWINQTLKINVIPFVFLFLIGIAPYQRILDKTYLPKEHGWNKRFYEISYFFKDLINKEHNPNTQYLLYDGYNAHLLFYLKILNKQGNKFFFKDWKKLTSTDVVIAHQSHIKKYIEEHYKQKIILVKGNVVKYKIIEEKK